MRTLLLRATVGVCLFLSLLTAGPKGNAGPLYERIICVVPLVGAGTLDDPKRPLFAPVAGDASQALPSHSKVRAFSIRPRLSAIKACSLMTVSKPSSCL